MSGDGTRIRPCDPAEIPALIALFRAAARATAPRDYTVEQVRAWAPDDIDPGAWAARCAGRATRVAERGGTPVGFIESEPDGHIAMLYVQPECQGQRVATRLLREAERHARSAGAQRLVTEASITARPFFERQGFRVIESQTVARRGQSLTN